MTPHWFDALFGLWALFAMLYTIIGITSPMWARAVSRTTTHQLLGHTVQLAITIRRTIWGKIRVDVHVRAID